MNKPRTKPRPQQRERLQESSSGGAYQIDREAGVIRNVRIIGTESRNKRRYLKEALASAVPMYEGAKVFVDHVSPDDSKQRAIRERWGKLQGVSQAADGALVGDLAYLKTHPETEAILEAAEKFQDFGLSHDVLGARRQEGGEAVVYEIAKVYSVDVVSCPATNQNFFESENPTMPKKLLLATLREHEKVSKPAALLVKRMQEMGEMFPETMPLGAELEDEASPEDQVEEAFKTAIMAILDMGDLDAQGKIDKIKMLLDVQDSLAEGGTGANPSPEAAAEAAAMKESLDALTAEAKKLREENSRLQESLTAAQAETAAGKAKAAVEESLRVAKREPTAPRVKALLALQESERAEVIESWPEDLAGAAKKPPASPAKNRLQEGELQVDGSDSLKKLLRVGK